jgi:hypothetical protein
MKKLIFAVLAVTFMAAPMANAQRGVSKDALTAKLAKIDATIADAKKAIFSFLAYEFSILLSRIYRLDKKVQKEKRKELMPYKWLLAYTHNPKVKKVAALNKLLGIRLTEYILNIYDRGK